jgi:hypothetical protein
MNQAGGRPEFNLLLQPGFVHELEYLPGSCAGQKQRRQNLSEKGHGDAAIVRGVVCLHLVGRW